MRLASEPAGLATRPRAAAPVRTVTSKAAAAAAAWSAEPVTAEIGGLFRELRRILKLSLPELAARLGTQIDVISALERGDVRRLPDWPETVRIVTAFTALGGIDARPVLGVLYREMQQSPQPASSSAGASQQRARAIAGSLVGGAVTGLRAATAIGGSAAAGVGRLGRFVPRLSRRTWIAIVIASILGGGYVAMATASEGEEPVSLFGPVTHLKRSVEDYVLWWQAPTREGLKWIEVDDPRSRRADRLNTGRR